MIVKSTRKKDIPISLNIRKSDGCFYSLERKQCIKYLDSLSWKYHISLVCSRISRNTGTIAKLRYYFSVKQLRQIYYNLIYPYISYGILAWGSAYRKHISKIQVKQNHSVKLIFFATAFNSETEKAKPLLNLLGLFTVNNIYRLQVSKFVHSWHKLAVCLRYWTTYFNMLVISIVIATTRCIQLRKKKILTSRAHEQTLGKKSISFMATDIWRHLPTHLKN